MSGERFQVRDARGMGEDWLPDWAVVDTVEKLCVATFDDEGEARRDCAERNEEDR